MRSDFYSEEHTTILPSFIEIGEGHFGASLCKIKVKKDKFTEILLSKFSPKFIKLVCDILAELKLTVTSVCSHLQKTNSYQCYNFLNKI